ncbi:cytochrome c [Lysobacter avium]|uniref:Cytochrome c n=1 Tax=Novilysobacter avium TaxID=2781023 RepID=A0A7S6UIY4_9GAMM|nr:cytochrome c [Lysobacter avium]
MTSRTRKAVLTGSILAAVAIIAGGAIWSGAYNVAADDPHSRPVYSLLELARDRSIQTRAGKLQVPVGLGSDDQIRQGAGNYDAMCAACHLAPGVSQTELSRGLYPAPPDLTEATVDQAAAFWVIKHGIKASGMPAWGLSMDDEYIWNMAAFLQKLPDLDATGYRALVDSSDGHSHGGGETMDDHHDVVHPTPAPVEVPASEPVDPATPPDDHSNHDHQH